jgi:hypothetical protein
MIGYLTRRRKNTPMLLSDIETAVRADLFDPAAARWATSDLDRAKKLV